MSFPGVASWRDWITCGITLLILFARQLASSVGTFEVVLTFEGTTPETGNTVQVMQIRNTV